jgi:hypothetical protein
MVMESSLSGTEDDIRKGKNQQNGGVKDEGFNGKAGEDILGSNIC